MLRSLSRKLSRRGRQSPEFVCETARDIERKAQARPSFEAKDEQSFTHDRYAGTQLEALALEPIIAPTLVRQRPRVAPLEAMVQPNRRGSQASVDIAQPPRALVPMHMGPGQVRSDVVLLQRPIPGITLTPTDDTPDPFDMLPQPLPQAQRPKPQRPILRRNAVSVRTQRDLPLRIQAIRRAHQEEFARELDAREPVFGQTGGLRRPMRQPIPEPDKLSPDRAPRPRARAAPEMPRESELYIDAAQAYWNTPDYGPEAPLSCEVDYYIESAQQFWDVPKSPTSGHAPI